VEDANEFEIQDASPAPIYASDDEDEAAELAAADAEIDAEEEELDDDDSADEAAELIEDEPLARAGDEDGEIVAGDDGETVAEIAPQIQLDGEVYARIHECLATQLAGVEAQIARADAIAEADPFFDRWRVVLIAQRDRLLRQIDEAKVAKAKAPARAAPAEAAEGTSELDFAEDEDEAGAGAETADSSVDAEPEPLSA